MASVGNNQSTPLLQLSGEAANEPSSFPFNEIIAELQMMILNEMDYPTKSSFAMTCRNWVHLNRDFNPYTFADQCAKLGYEHLFAYSLSRGGPFDTKTAEIAAEHGRLEFLLMFVERQVDKSSISKVRLVWAENAARHGKQNVLDWLKVDDWTADKNEKFHHFGRLASAAAEGGQTTLARQYLNKVHALGIPTTFNTEDRIIFNFAANDFLESALQFLEFYPDRDILFGNFYRTVRNAGIMHFKPRLIKWAMENEPTLPSFDLDDLAHRCCHYGALPMLIFATENGAELDSGRITTILEGCFVNRESAYFECLQYIHERLKLSTAPDLQVDELPPWATRESMRWMLDHGYRFDRKTMLDKYLEHHLADLQRDKREYKRLALDLKLINWMLNQGAPVTNHTLLKAACTCNLDLLDFFWAWDPETFKPAQPLIPRFFSLMLTTLKTYSAKSTQLVLLTPLKRTVQWFLDKGYNWGEDLKPYTDFLERVHSLSPKRKELLLSFAQDLKMPENVLSTIK